jgi:hypothetical protein
MSSRVLPNIYFIVVEDYGSSRTLKEFYDFDNSQFDEFLVNQGFYIAQNSYSNYPKTTFSLAATFNLDYVQNIIRPKRPDTAGSVLLPLFQNSKVVQALKSVGYKYYHVGSWYDATISDIAADENLGFRDHFLNLSEGQKKFVDTTAAGPILRKFVSIDPLEQQHENLQHQRSIFPEIVKRSGPKYVFVHILIPHSPYIYKDGCERTTKQERRDGELTNFLRQVECTNVVMKEMVGEIRANDPGAAIVLQTDEGPAAMRYPLKESYYFKDASLESIRERTSILNAFYFPDGDYTVLYPTITPINTFPALFKKYVDLSYPYIEDRVYTFEDQHHLFGFIEVTDSLFKAN